MALWIKIEDHLLKNYKATTALYKRIHISVVIMILMFLLEHTLAIFSFLYSSNCQNNSTGAEHLFKKQFHYFFTYMPYHVLGVAVLIVSPSKFPATLYFYSSSIWTGPPPSYGTSATSS
jgi:hypothetical protein